MRSVREASTSGAPTFGDTQASGSATTRHPAWLTTPGGEVATWLHVPRASLARTTGVVVCPPFGYEYTHAHRSLIHLADALAQAGFLAMRIDYLGTGDSQGDARTPNLLDRWVESVEAAARQLEELTGGGPSSLIGLRFGALIAATAASRIDVQHLVAWHPVVNGRRYIREHEALQHFAEGAPEEGTDVLEAGGFLLTRETVGAVKRMDLTRHSYRVRGQVLILERDDLTADPGWADQLTDQGIPTLSLPAAGYLEMMAEPQYTVVPAEAIRLIVEWLGDATPKEVARVEPEPLRHLLARRSAEWAVEGEALVEELVSIPGGTPTGLFAVLTTPRDQGCGETGVVVLSNSGSVHHVGPNRLYVDLARGMAAAGVASLRLDLRNLGDSRLGTCPDENHPYPDTAVGDVSLALEWLVSERGFGRCVVAGLCSGAHTAFHAGLELIAHPIAGVVGINPLTFHWEPGMSLDTPTAHQTTRDAQYYRRVARDRAKWAKLLRGQANLAYIGKFVVRRGMDRLRFAARSVLGPLGLRTPGLLERDLTEYQAARRPLHFVFSSTDPGHAILMSEAGRVARRLIRQGSVAVTFVKGADHTFSRERWRSQAVDAVKERVKSLLGHDAPLDREVIPYHEGLWSSIEPAWSALSERTGDPSAFLSSTWVSGWIEAFGARFRPSGVVWRDEDGTPVACALLSLSDAMLGPFPITRAHLNASGVPAVGCEHNDVLTLPAFRAAVLDDLVQMVLDERIDELALVGFRDDAAEEVRSRWPERSWEGNLSESPYVSLERLRAIGEPYLTSLSANTRGQVRRSLRLYTERFGAPSARIAEPGEEAATWFAEMLLLHAERWEKRGTRGAFEEGPVRRFHARMLERAPGGGEGGPAGLSVDLVRVAFGDEAIGFLYHLRYRGRVSFYQSGLRYHDDNRLKPGMVAHALAIQHYIEMGAEEYDFLGGEVDPVRYKRSLATDRRTLAWMQLPAPGPKMRTLRHLRHARRRVRSIQSRA